MFHHHPQLLFFKLFPGHCGGIVSFSIHINCVLNYLMLSLLQFEHTTYSTPA